MVRRKRYTVSEKLKVIYRKENDGGIIAFLPELSANRGRIVCYAHLGQHSEADIDYYSTTTAATPAEYAELHKELQGIYNDVVLNIKRRLYRNDLYQKAWKKPLTK